MEDILAEGAIALSVTLSGGALFASWKLLQFLSSLIVKVILAIFMRASAQQICCSHELKYVHWRKIYALHMHPNGGLGDIRMVMHVYMYIRETWERQIEREGKREIQRERERDRENEREIEREIGIEKGGKIFVGVWEWLMVNVANNLHVFYKYFEARFACIMGIPSRPFGYDQV